MLNNILNNSEKLFPKRDIIYTSNQDKISEGLKIFFSKLYGVINRNDIKYKEGIELKKIIDNNNINRNDILDYIKNHNKGLFIFFKELYNKSGFVLYTSINEISDANKKIIKDKGYIIISKSDIIKQKKEQISKISEINISQIIDRQISKIEKEIFLYGIPLSIYYIDENNVKEKHRTRIINMLSINSYIYFINELPYSNNKETLDILKMRFRNIEISNNKASYFIKIDNFDKAINNNKIKILKLIFNNKEKLNKESIKGFLNNFFEYKETLSMTHDNNHHKETVGEHIYNVFINGINYLEYENNILLLLSTLFHDFGKYYTKQFNENFDRFTFDLHQKKSADIFELFYKDSIIDILKLSKDEYLLTLNIIKNHNDLDYIYKEFKSEGINKCIEEINKYLNEKELLMTGYKRLMIFQWLSDKEGAIKDKKDTNRYIKIKEKLLFLLK